ncbi:MAG: hypothetical protein Q9174_004768 [Haloplaca sp. 1 TL-2023]
MISSRFPSLGGLFDGSGSRTTKALGDMLEKNWYLGLTSFGGPAVHFQIFHRMFVEKYNWIDEQMVWPSLPGPGSTKMLYCINVIHGGFLIGLLSFFVWSLPAAIATYGLSLGIARVDQQLPGPVYALLTGLNAATVGIVALAAVQLSQKAITDKLTRTLVFLGGTAGMLYNALWYFPILMVVGGASTVIWDYRWIQRSLRRVRKRPDAAEPQSEAQGDSIGNEVSSELPVRSNDQPARGHISAKSRDGATSPFTSNERVVPAGRKIQIFAWKLGVTVIVCFFVGFIAIMVLRGTLQNATRGFNLFANLFLAGTIIFGGGPVVIPLLREYVVAEGWVSTRDFLLGLALIQAFPGPNFNFAVYLGSLSAVSSPSLPSAAGALIGYIGIFSPGLILHTGAVSLWQTLRGYRWVTSCLRGVNATAVGLVYSAVYRLWEIGFLDEAYQTGSSLGRDPWWVVVTATSFVGGMWFKLPAPAAILLGGAMGMVWYGVTSA